MSRRTFFILLSILFLLPLLVLIVPKVLAQYGTYTVSGYVYDDQNANGRYDCSPAYCETGIPGKKVYANNNTLGQFAYTDAYGYWRIDNLAAGQHSIEIADAGSGGSRPTTGEKFVVNGTNTGVQFGVQQGGYAVEGRVTDIYGRPVTGATVYTDLPNRQRATTDANGYYRIDNVGYDQSTPIYGFSGGHNIYVEGYETTPVWVNPQYQTVSMPANFTVRTDQTGPSCGPTYARDPYNPSNCAYFQNRCSLPASWVEVGSCTQVPPGGICTEGQVISTTQRCNGQYYCSYDTIRRANCTTYEREYNCNLSSICSGSQQPPIVPGGQCTQGQSAGTTQRCVGQQSCTVPLYYNSNCTTYEGSPYGCQYMSGQCGYQSPQYGCPPGFSGPGCGIAYSADSSYLQGQIDNNQSFQDLSWMNQPIGQWAPQWNTQDWNPIPWSGESDPWMDWQNPSPSYEVQSAGQDDFWGSDSGWMDQSSWDQNSWVWSE